MLTSEFYPVMFQEGRSVYWQPAFPDGTRLYYDEDRLVYATEVRATKLGYTPAVCNSRRRAIKESRHTWAQRVTTAKEELQREDNDE